MEDWRAVVGYEGIYSVSSLGRVRRERSSRGTCAGRILCGSQQSEGYWRVGLSRHRDQKVRLVHVLVAEAFLGPRPIGCEVNHINGVKTDNRAENLEWVTRKENIAHSVRTGLAAFGDRNGSRRHPERLRRGDANPMRARPDLVPRGEKRGGAKLTPVRVRMIRMMRDDEGATYAEIARRFGISPVTAFRVAKRLKWRHVE